MCITRDGGHLHVTPFLDYPPLYSSMGRCPQTPTSPDGVRTCTPVMRTQRAKSVFRTSLHKCEIGPEQGCTAINCETHHRAGYYGLEFLLTFFSPADTLSRSEMQ